jgi:hypothetical protein
MIGTIERYCNDHGHGCADHIALLRSDVGAKRFRPEEAAAGVITTQPPLVFHDARALGDEILQDLAQGRVVQ